jgi:GTP pyrophosphokinase
MTDIPPFAEQFDLHRTRYQDLCERLEVLLRQLLRERQIPVHSISARMKSRDSSLKKVGRKPASYRVIDDMTDLAGVRIITYFSDQVDSVAKVIEEEFVVDAANSVDKRDALDPDQFGYLSLHYVVALSIARCALTEYHALQGLKAEIQIRSILQHAWAEIEHDLGYKTATELPRSVRRQFARLAGLLELADGEFVAIRSAIDAYSRDVAAKIVQQPGLVDLDKVSLVDFVRSDALVRELDGLIASDFNYGVRQDEESVGGDVAKLQFFGLRTIADVRSALERHRNDVVQLGERWSATNDDEPSISDSTMPEGVSLFYLCHLLAGASQDISKATSYYQTFSIGDGDDQPDEIAQDVLRFMRSRRPREAG